MDRLPDEILLRIGQYCATSEWQLLQLERVSRSWQRLVQDQTLWYTLFKRQYHRWSYQVPYSAQKALVDWRAFVVRLARQHHAAFRFQQVTEHAIASNQHGRKRKHSLVNDEVSPLISSSSIDPSSAFSSPPSTTPSTVVDQFTPFRIQDPLVVDIQDGQGIVATGKHRQVTFSSFPRRRTQGKRSEHKILFWAYPSWQLVRELEIHFMPPEVSCQIVGIQSIPVKTDNGIERVRLFALAVGQPVELHGHFDDDMPGADNNNEDMAAADGRVDIWQTVLIYRMFDDGTTQCLANLPIDGTFMGREVSFFSDHSWHANGNANGLVDASSSSSSSSSLQSWLNMVVTPENNTPIDPANTLFMLAIGPASADADGTGKLVRFDLRGHRSTLDPANVPVIWNPMLRRLVRRQALQTAVPTNQRNQPSALHQLLASSSSSPFASTLSSHPHTTIPIQQQQQQQQQQQPPHQQPASTSPTAVTVPPPKVIYTVYLGTRVSCMIHFRTPAHLNHLICCGSYEHHDLTIYDWRFGLKIGTLPWKQTHTSNNRAAQEENHAPPPPQQQQPQPPFQLPPGADTTHLWDRIMDGFHGEQAQNPSNLDVPPGTSPLEARINHIAVPPPPPPSSTASSTPATTAAASAIASSATSSSSSSSPPPPPMPLTLPPAITTTDTLPFHGNYPSNYPPNHENHEHRPNPIQQRQLDVMDRLLMPPDGQLEQQDNDNNMDIDHDDDMGDDDDDDDGFGFDFREVRPWGLESTFVLPTKKKKKEDDDDDDEDDLAHRGFRLIAVGDNRRNRLEVKIWDISYLLKRQWEPFKHVTTATTSTTMSVMATATNTDNDDASAMAAWQNEHGWLKLFPWWRHGTPELRALGLRMVYERVVRDERRFSVSSLPFDMRRLLKRSPKLQQFAASVKWPLSPPQHAPPILLTHTFDRPSPALTTHAALEALRHMDNYQNHQNRQNDEPVATDVPGPPPTNNAMPATATAIAAASAAALILSPHAPLAPREINGASVASVLIGAHDRQRGGDIQEHANPHHHHPAMTVKYTAYNVLHTSLFLLTEDGIITVLDIETGKVTRVIDNVATHAFANSSIINGADTNRSFADDRIHGIDVNVIAGNEVVVTSREGILRSTIHHTQNT
ncbi:hypothetical protein BC940DRAFT_318290 [Gongronella butleri]|nr:hypothetical protein BC940DRAFT_318290 [Gongronella butleri]